MRKITTFVLCILLVTSCLLIFIPIKNVKAETELTLGVPFSDELEGTWDVKYYQVWVNAGEHLFVSLDKAWLGALGINYGVLPTASDNDGWKEDWGDSIVEINTTQGPGYYYIVVCSTNFYYGVYNITAMIISEITLENEYPENGSTGMQRPPSQLQVTARDHDADVMNISIRWKNHYDLWTNLISYINVGNGTYQFIPPLTNDWIWGNTTYSWSVNVTDGNIWINRTYHYTTSGSRYDVNNNNAVNFQDAGLVWVHRTSLVPYDGVYDVNHDGQVNFQDAGLTWVHRD